jgi:flavin-binding protein dodecin
MSEHAYKIVELAGSSDRGIQDAIEVAIARASATTRNLRWFEVTQTRGQIANGKVERYQVILKAGFTLEEPSPR